MQQSDTQFRLLIKTTLSKLDFKLTKSRAISKHTIQSTIINELNNLSQVPNDSRNFERGLDILKMKLSQLVRSDRTADVWEDLIGELTVLESSIHTLSKMIESQHQLSVLKSQLQKQPTKPKKTWSVFGFSVSTTDTQPSAPLPVTVENPPIDRLTKVIRNVIIAQEYLGDEVKELKKLALALNKCIDKTYVLENSPDTIVDKLVEPTNQEAEETANDEKTQLDLEDRVYIEIVRKLRGDDEDIVVGDYLKELCDIYRIDLYNEGKYKDDGLVTHDDNDKGDTENTKNRVKKQLDDLDDLKSRFEALKK